MKFSFTWTWTVKPFIFYIERNFTEPVRPTQIFLWWLGVFPSCLTSLPPDPRSLLPSLRLPPVPPEEVRVASYRRLSGQEKRTKVACLNGPSVLSPSQPPPPLPAEALFLRCLELSHAIDFARFLNLVPDCWCLRQPCPNSTSVWNLLRVNDKNPEKIRIANLYLFYVN